MLKKRMKEELIELKLIDGKDRVEAASVAEYNKDSCLHKTLIHDYQKRSESGELAKLRSIFDNSALNFELKVSKLDINMEDQKLDRETLISLWEMVENEGQIPAKI